MAEIDSAPALNAVSRDRKSARVLATLFFFSFLSVSLLALLKIFEELNTVGQQVIVS